MGAGCGDSVRVGRAVGVGAGEREGSADVPVRGVVAVPRDRDVAVPPVPEAVAVGWGREGVEVTVRSGLRSRSAACVDADVTLGFSAGAAEKGGVGFPEAAREDVGFGFREGAREDVGVASGPDVESSLAVPRGPAFRAGFSEVGAGVREEAGAGVDLRAGAAVGVAAGVGVTVGVGVGVGFGVAAEAPPPLVVDVLPVVSPVLSPLAVGLTDHAE
ncbi:hypothetical protein GCM10007964_43780 [Sphaerisporangium melleum]|uniref:Uncharacterized protein n=1 Tax=Sphaerisporangium melleum TaxID=321316 RepID=A0A917R989_9ACTN|nr:hypothetical protein GCM10007964_43780 [Sphaerisporangium melleum]